MPDTKTSLTFSEFKALINTVDEQVWGSSRVVIGDRPVVDIAFCSGLPACDNRFHGKHPATPSRVEIEAGPPPKPYLLTVFDFSQIGGPMWQAVSTPKLKEIRVVSPEAALTYLKREFPGGAYPSKLEVGKDYDCRCYGITLKEVKGV